jgi:hypothetical protein
MDPKKLFIDERFRGFCVYCGDVTNSRDHTPSKVLLDEPYPENLPVSEACSDCNGGFSADEEYLSCLIECVIQGTTKPDERFREKVARTLQARPAIASVIEIGKRLDQHNNPIWQPEWSRVRNIILKLARGHISYELGLIHIEEPIIIDILPILSMTDDELEKFNSIDEYKGMLYPEIGSRAFINLLKGKPTAYSGWHVIQDGRYRYAIGQSSGDWVKFVLSEYLACRVVWES